MTTMFLIVCSLLLLTLSQVTISKPAQLTEDGIFGFLADLDTEDLLYSCNFLKTHRYVCNVTQQGAVYLKGKANQKDGKRPAYDKPGKIAIFNVTGEWSDSDGFIKQFYSQAENIDTIAKCFFRLAYYECFGIPKCDGSSGFSPCSGGEPWRGSYTGAPNVGFRGNVTAQAMQGSAKSPLMPAGNSGESNRPEEVDLPAVVNVDSEKGNAGNVSANNDQMLVEHFSSTDNKTGMISRGTIAMSPDKKTVIVTSSGTMNDTNPDGSFRIGGFASSSSSFSSSSDNDFTNSSENGFIETSASKPRRRPIIELFPSLFQSTSLGDLFGSLTSVVNRPKVTQPVPAPSTSQSRSRNCDNSNSGSSVYDFPSLRCVIDNFQRNVMNNIFSSLQNSFARMNFGNFGSTQPANAQVQTQPIAAAQSRMDMDRPRMMPSYGVQVSARSGQSNPFFSAVSDDDGDSWPSFF